jgi:putative ABC transport system permease protein
MKKEYFLIIWKGIQYRKIRTALTILGIIIGIGAIVALLLVSTGLENSIKEQFAKMGSNRLYVTIKTQGLSLQSGLTDDDVGVFERMNEFKWVTPYVIKQWPVEYAKKTKFLQVTANPIDNMGGRWADLDFSVAEGRIFNNNDKYSAVIGQRIANDIFDKKASVNSNILINGITFKVIGVFDKFGNPESDSMIHIPIDAAREILGGNDKSVNMIELVVKPGINPENTGKKAKEELRKKRGYKEGDEDFDISTPEQLLGQLNSVLGIVQAVLVAIAIISLIVGSIGIMNSMFTSVLERTRDIGVMRAVGATSNDILVIFLLESTLVGLFGGAIGALTGIGVSKMFEWVASNAGYNIFKVAISPALIVFSIIFSGLIGLIAGYLPSRSASNLRPVEALR